LLISGELAAALVLMHLAATLYMVGLIWFVQVVHYPLFARVGTDAFSAYERAHVSRTHPVVGPAMLLEAASALALLVTSPSLVPPGLAWVGLLLLAVIWLSTALLQVPRHRELAAGFEPAAHARLVASNWIRTLGWTARGTLALWLVHRAMVQA
jgi:hypothetical protein